MDITTIQSLIKNDIIMTKHARKRLKQRDIKVSALYEAINKGKIIEHDPERTPRPISLIHYENIHVVLSTDDSYVYLVSCYHWDDEHFESDGKTRKKDE